MYPKCSHVLAFYNLALETEKNQPLRAFVWRLLVELKKFRTFFGVL